ncbi:HTH domain-containing protein [Nannocystis radixulma]|uniref:HTH domain-containing protein n=1 Tax=Nannocystis radixulma TaxID=2995305 RepID=A0ABT5BNS2_9BACT|nr:HTH domain-containing protein [Nannocystis radixulma]MDC0675819.1 HTH domain-containing protein [Nannocystis radixulma]
MTGESEFLRAARIVLSDSARPMTARELTDKALERGLLPDKFSGKTPHQTMKSKLSVHIKTQGEQSEFARADPGKFSLRNMIANPYRTKQKEHHREQVLVFPARALDKLGRFQGIDRKWKRYAKHILTANTCTYMERMEAECNNEYKQVLCYILVTKGDHLLAFNRGSYSRTEDMLRGRACVGFGGHASNVDFDLFSGFDLGLTSCAIRELGEELSLPVPDLARLNARSGLEIIGALNDDSSAIGKRHFAFIFRYEVSDDPKWSKPERGERGITQLRWLCPPRDQLPLHEFEYWSQMCLRTFYASSVHAQPSFRIRRRRPLAPPHVLVMLGGIGSGKSEATKVLVDEFGYNEINSGRVLAQILGIPPVTESNRQRFQRTAWNFISTSEGPRQLAKAIWEQVFKGSSERILIDGIRQRTTLAALREFAAGRRLGIVFIHTPPDIAYKLYSQRDDSRIHDVHDFLNIRNESVEEEVLSLISEADAVVYNWFGRLAYHRVLRELIGATSSIRTDHGTTKRGRNQ